MAPNHPLPGRSRGIIFLTDVTVLIGADVELILQCWSSSAAAGSQVGQHGLRNNMTKSTGSRITSPPEQNLKCI